MTRKLPVAQLEEAAARRGMCMEESMDGEGGDQACGVTML